MLNNFKSYLESIHVTPTSWLVGISGVLMARFFLEVFSNPTSSGFFSSDASTLLHYSLFFMVIVVIFMIILQIFAPDWRPAIPRLVAVSFPVIFIAPIVDFIASGGRGIKMLYLFDSPGRMFLSFFSFTNKSLGGGATIGLQIEIALVLLFVGLFVYLVSKNWGKAVISSLVLYAVIFILSSLPGVMNIIGGGADPTQNYFGQPLFFIQESIKNSATISNNINGSLQYSSAVRMFEVAFNFMMGRILFLILAIAAFLWFRLNFKEKLLAIIKNSRPERLAHCFLMISLGLFVSHIMFPLVKLNWNDWLSVAALFVSFLFSCLFAICVNDLADEKIDKISNQNRPLITGILNREDMKQSAFIFLVASLVSGFLAGYTAFFFILAFTALYYIYSASPARLKTIPFLSSFIIGLCTLAPVLAGFFLVSPIKYISAFPLKLALAVVVVFFLGSHIRDVKDIEGDRKAGVKTVPVLFGDKWGPRVVGIFAALAFLLVPIFLSAYFLLIAAIPVSLAVYYFVNRKPYAEKYIFITYFIFVLASILLLLA